MEVLGSDDLGSFSHIPISQLPRAVPGIAVPQGAGKPRVQLQSRGGGVGERRRRAPLGPGQGLQHFPEHCPLPALLQFSLPGT